MEIFSEGKKKDPVGDRGPHEKDAIMLNSTAEVKSPWRGVTR